MLARELDRSLRYRQPLSLILFDIDHFKKINDEYGHQAGDRVLCELARLGNDLIRFSDILFRWGGEEFSIIVPSTNYQGAVQLAETLCKATANHHFPKVGMITISLGVTEYHSAESIEHWFVRTDKMLYAAKHAGRNTVRAAMYGNSDRWPVDDMAVLGLRWDQSYECGEASIDEEHRELFALANELIKNYFIQDNKKEKILAAYDRLLAHISVHFANEEALLARHDYPNAEVHQRIHAGLLRRAQELRNNFDRDAMPLGSMIEFLANDVVAQHLFKADRDFFYLFGH